MNWLIVALIAPIVLPFLRFLLIWMSKRRSESKRLAMLFYCLCSFAAASILLLMQAGSEGFYGSMLLVPVWLVLLVIAVYSDARSYFQKAK